MIRFTAADGVAYEVKGSIGLPREWPLGKSVDLRYRRSNPNHTSDIKAWHWMVFSGAFAGFAVALWWALLS